MAESAADFQHGSMEVAEHRATFQGFMKLIKWSCLVLAVLLLFLTLVFCTRAGFVTALVLAVIVAAVGSWFMVRRRGPH